MNEAEQDGQLLRAEGPTPSSLFCSLGFLLVFKLWALNILLQLPGLLPSIMESYPLEPQGKISCSSYKVPWSWCSITEIEKSLRYHSKFSLSLSPSYVCVRVCVCVYVCVIYRYIGKASCTLALCSLYCKDQPT